MHNGKWKYQKMNVLRREKCKLRMKWKKDLQFNRNRAIMKKIEREEEKMKKIITLVLAMVLVLSSFGMVAQAGGVVGQALHTDIVAYINHFAIPSYIVNGTSVIVAEDLRNFGFNVDWDPYDRSLNIYRNGSETIGQFRYVSKDQPTGAVYCNIYYSDIVVWAEGKQITSYNIDGLTMIPMEELTMLGEIAWDGNARTLKMWVDGLKYIDPAQPVSKKYYPGTSIPDFGWVTTTPCVNHDGDYWFYVADNNNLQTYIEYIEDAGYHYTMNKQDDGDWILCYINSRTRNGVALIEHGGIVQVQTGTGIDYWE